MKSDKKKTKKKRKKGEILAAITLRIVFHPAPESSARRILQWDFRNGLN